jgi:hypothetical protein
MPVVDLPHCLRAFPVDPAAGVVFGHYRERRPVHDTDAGVFEHAVRLDASWGTRFAPCKSSASNHSVPRNDRARSETKRHDLLGIFTMQAG